MIRPLRLRLPILVLLALLASGGLGACGKRGTLELPAPPPPEQERETEVG